MQFGYANGKSSGLRLAPGLEGACKVEKAKLERFVMERVKAACEVAIRDTIDALNAQGHRFEPADDFLCEFREPGADWSIQIHAGVGVFTTKADAPRPADPVSDAFYAAADSGEPLAERLVAMEADVGNGGFDQLHLNKGLEFIDACVEDLRAIGAKSTLKYIEQARQLFAENADLFQREATLRKALNRLDSKFNTRKESLAVLYERSRNRLRAE